jgi:hypothetical protein
MGKRGPKPTALQDLLFWEGLWYRVFLDLRGDRPSHEKVSRNRKLKEVLRKELEKLGKRVPKDLVEADWAARRKIQLDRELQPKTLISEPDTWHALVAANTAADVQRACRESKRWLKPNWNGRPYVQDLYDHADEFVRAKKQNVYYSRRRSGDEQRVTFFARAMAGISLGLSPNTGIDRLRKIKHGGKCPCIHCDFARWDRIHRQIYKRKS